MSDLHTSIAAALKTANDRVAGFIGYDEMADAVIQELEKDYMLVPNPCETYPRLVDDEWCACGHAEDRHERSTGMCAVITPMCDCTGFKEADDE